MNRKTIGVVLAGGQSSRMGCDKKAILLADGKTFLQHAIERLASRCETIIVAGMPKPLPTDPNPIVQYDGWVDDQIVFLPDALRFRGPLSGLLTALQWILSQETRDDSKRASQVLVTPVDMPNLTPHDLDQLLATAALHDDGSPQPTVATFDEIHHDPLVAIYPIALANELRELAQTEDQSLSRWLAQRAIFRCTLPQQSGMNMNTSHDLEQLSLPLQPFAKRASH